MKKVNPSDMTTKDLVDRFAQIGRAQDQALLGGQIAKFNRLFDQMAEISKELKGRPGDERHACPYCHLLSMLTLSQVDVDAGTSKPYYYKEKETLWDVPTDAIAQSVEEVPAVG